MHVLLCGSVMTTFALLVVLMVKKCIGANDYSSEKKCTRRRHDLSLSAGRQQSWLQPSAVAMSSISLRMGVTILTVNIKMHFSSHQKV